MGGSGSKYVIEGTVAPGFESVRKMFEQDFARGADENAQLCVYLGEEKIIDLWGKTDEKNGFDGDSLTNVFSSTKSITAILIAMAQDRGWCKYEDKISQHWPEFAQADKESVTLADLMRHESGLSNFSEPVEISDVQTENIKKNCAGAKIAKMSQSWPDNGGRRQYHAFTRGCIANEVFRRVSLDNKTLGEFLRSDLAGPLNADTYIGCTSNRYYTYSHIGGAFWGALKKSLGLTSHMDQGIGELFSLIKALRGLVTKPDFVGMEGNLMKFNEPEYRSAEIGSVNGNCSARGLAKLAAVMANKGTFGSDTFLSKAGWEAMHDGATKAPLIFGAEYKFTQGGVCEWEGKRDGWYGWMGYGGSVFQWHPALRLGIGYTCTLLNPMSMTNAKCEAYQVEIVKCAKNRGMN